MQAAHPIPAPHTSRLLLSELIGALTYALDLTEGQPPGHSLRCCWIGFHVGRKLGMVPSALWELYYTLLLKDAGCSSNAARLCELYGSDDRLAKHDFKTVDTDDISQLVQFVLAHTGVKGPLAERFKKLLHLARHGERLATELIQTRCDRGAQIARQLGFGEAVASGIFSLDEHWNGRGKPQRLAGKDIPINARIALLAQVIDVFHHMGGARTALDEVRKRRGSWFDPELVDIVLSFEHQQDFWTALHDEDIRPRVVALEPESRAMAVDDDSMDRIAQAFSQVIDAKSPYTSGHSARVALYTDLLAVKFGFDESRRRWLKRGALLHDMGKLGVSNSVLDKAGALNDEEWKEVRMHPVYTRQILALIAPFQDLAVVAGAHHERLDGKGYPNNLVAADLSLETRMITLCDIFDAITADRPYRGPIPVPQALEMMGRMVGTALDPDCYALLVECTREIQMP